MKYEDIASYFFYGNSDENNRKYKIENRFNNNMFMLV